MFKEYRFSQADPEIPYREFTDDEIYLVQLFQILLKRKNLIIVVVLICLAAGIGYALLKKSVYEYTTTVQIGTAMVGNGESAAKTGIEDSPSVELELEKVYQ